MQYGGTMDPIVVVVPHRHGKAEAARRIKSGIESATTRYAAEFKIAEQNWDGDRLRFRVAVLGQPVTGTIDVSDAEARAEVTLTWLMAHLVKPAEAIVRREGESILGSG
jgi:Putative polyhydroxyalkanoic acid system protein (PHA_gran_rgn)